MKMTFKAIFGRFGEFLEKVGWEEGFSENCLKGHFWPFNAKNWFYQDLAGETTHGEAIVLIVAIEGAEIAIAEEEAICVSGIVDCTGPIIAVDVYTSE